MTETPCPYPFRRAAALDPPEELRTLRDEPVVPATLPSGDVAWLVTRYEDIRTLLCHPHVSRNIMRPGAARMSKNNMMFQDSKMDPDPPAHTRLRRLVMKAFTATRVENLRPHVQKVADELVDGMIAAGPPADLNTALSFPMTIRIICELLGVPVEDRDRFRGWTDAFLSVSKFDREEIGRAMGELNGYMADLIKEKRERPRDDLISALIGVRDTEDGRLSEYELHWWSRLLLLVGYETTAAQLSASVAVLLTHPDQAKKLREDPGLVPQAVEELLRLKLLGSSLSMLRYVTEDIEIGGRTIPKGTSVIPVIESANVDASVIDRPDEFDVGRGEAHHLTFSVGPHFCVGAALARLQLQVAIETLLRRLPELRLTVSPAELRRNEGALMEGLLEVPVAW
ncbi:cytochrome P450 [Actinoallomurus sp. CA-142502]|uniref:cytochrome P450 n=1 Tax=Actinoallomurus sp. CA-142502 TaxID=3239885 RepID=UPI003D94A292